MLKDTACGISTFCKVEIMAGPKTDAQFHFTGIEKIFPQLSYPQTLTYTVAFSPY